jgi:hypothetical protein
LLRPVDPAAMIDVIIRKGVPMPTLDRRTRAPAAAAPGLQALEARSYLSFTSVAGFTIGHDAQSPTALTTVIALAADRPGNFFAAGMFRGIADLDPARNRSRTFDAADGHTYVAKYTASGKLAWAQQLPDSAVVRDVTTDRAGNLYVVGQLTGTTDFNFDQARRFNLSPRDGSWDAFVARYDSTGGLVWAARYGTGDIEDAAAIAVDGLGYVHVAGTTSDGSPGTNPFLATYSARGKSVRADTFGDTFDTTLVDLAAAPAGDVYLAGVNYRATTFSAGGVSRAVSDNTAYLLKVDPRGRLAWIDGFDPFHDDTASLAADDAGVYLAGYDSGADLNPARSKTYTLDNGGGYLAKSSSRSRGRSATTSPPRPTTSPSTPRPATSS